MRHALIVLALAAAPALAGDLVVRNKQAGLEVRISEAPCTSAVVLEAVRPEYAPRLHAARATLPGKVIPGCWMEHEGTALMLFENGEQLAVELSAFSDPSV